MMNKACMSKTLMHGTLTLEKNLVMISLFLCLLECMCSVGRALDWMTEELLL